ncbi:hypothetical protein Gotur_012685 [Gossypium turneri]
MSFYIEKCFSMESNKEQPSFCNKFLTYLKCFWADENVEFFSFSAKKCF